MVSNLIRFIIILVAVTLAVLAVLGVVGALSSQDLRENAVKVLQLAGIALVTSLVVLLATSKK